MSHEPPTGEPLSPLKQAIVELRALRARVSELEGERSAPIAIVGAGLRLPGGARDEASLWQLLADGVDAIGPIPRDRWDAEAYFDADADAPGKMYTRHGGFLGEVDGFDAEFFGVSPREAASMDPQQRLLLEVAWEALENAAIAPSGLAGTTGGVFLGCGNSDYWRMVYRDEVAIDAYSALGNSFSVAAGRLSYLLGLHGPSLAVDTACSASLVAIHLACRSLRAGECSLALAGGVNLMLSPELSINFSKSRMLAADGRCKTFDAAADGYVRGEGCGIVVLKTLAAAEAAGDRILAVIRGTAINQDGRSGGLTAPNGPAQEAVIRAALKDAGVAPHDISYLEAHGTGTALGDPIEIRAASAVLCQNRPRHQPLSLGTIKTNMGHLEAAAGVAGLLKVILALQRKQIPPHLHLKHPTQHIDWERTPLVIPTTLTTWQPINGRRIAGLSSFGFSGTNAHVIVEEAPAAARTAPVTERSRQILALSAKNAAALREQAVGFASILQTQPALPLADVCFSANAGRSHFSHRLTVVGETTETIRAGLEAYLHEQSAPQIRVGTSFDPKPPVVAFLFTGQGSQYLGMGRELYDTSPVFRRTLDRCAEILRPLLDKPLLEILYPATGTKSSLDETACTQPALFAVEYALAELWRSWGVQPAYVMGHSVGEYVAACVAGVFSLEDGLKLIAERGRLMQALPAGGRMVAVFASAERVGAVLAPYPAVSIAAVNGPEAVVVSGDGGQVGQLLQQLSAQGIKGKDLVVSHAFHSPLMEPMLDRFEQVAAGVAYAEPRIGLVSNVTGGLADLRLVGSAAYWRRHVRAPVLFADAIRTLDQAGVRTFIEVGPAPVLVGMAQRCVDGAGRLWLPSLRPRRGDWEQLMETMQALYTAGANPDWAGLDQGCARRRLSLPTYPFQRRRYWIERSSASFAAQPDPARSWAAAAAAGLRQSRATPLQVNLSTYAEKWRCLDDLTTAHAAHTLRSLGAFARDGEDHDPDSLIAQLGIPAMYRHLLQRWLERLQAAGRLRLESGKFRRTSAWSQDDLAAVQQRVDTALADDPALLAYLRNCGNRLTAVMAGKESPLETLFPGGSSELAEQLYENANVNRYVNAIAGAVVEAVSRGWMAQRPLRILEVGAGTGATTATLLPALDPARSAYLFTDVSDLFLGRARGKFGRFGFARFGVFDLEKELAGQGHAPGSFDVIVGANVVHAVRDLKGAIGRLSQLLVPGGFLLLVEATQHHSWFDFSTGLIEGWQHFADDLRGDNPLLTPEKWRAALTAHGFAEVLAFPEAGSPAEVLFQHVILARTAPREGGAAVPLVVFTELTGSTVNRGPAPAAAEVSAEDIREFRRQIEAALPDEREDLMNEFVRARVMQVLRLDTDRRPDRRHRLMDLGLDSLMAVQLRNLLETGLGLDRVLPASLMFDYPTIEAIAAVLLKSIAGEAVAVAPAPAPVRPPPTTSGRTQEIAALSDEEAEAQLLKRLERKRPTA